MAEQIPGPLRSILGFSRSVVNRLARDLGDPEQFRALRAELGLPAAPYVSDSITEVNDKLVEVDGRLAGAEAEDDENLASDDAILDLLDRTSMLSDVVQTVFQGRYDDDARSVADLSYALFGVLASEHLRTKHTWAWIVLRFIMFGYESVEEIPRFDPFTIFDRLTGNRQRTQSAADDFGWLELVGGIGIPPTIALINWLITRTEVQPERLAQLPDGTSYFDGEVTYKLGWEPDPDTPAPLQELFTRSATIRLTGARKEKNRATVEELTAALSFVHFHDDNDGVGFLIRIGADAAMTIDLAPHGAIKRTVEIDAVGAGGIDLWWTDEFLGYVGAAESNAHVGVEFLALGTDVAPAFRWGKPNKSRLDITGYGLVATISAHEQSLGVRVTAARLVIYPAELLPGFGEFFEAVGASKFEATFDGTLKWGAPHGLTFEGEAGLVVRLLTNKGIGGVARIAYLDMELKVVDGGVRLAAMVAGRFSIGVFTASIDRFGLSVPLDGAGKVEVLPPKGIGLMVDGHLIKGGGFLLLDFDAGEFAGALELTFCKWSLKALAILSTGGRDNPVDFALFVLIYARWPHGLPLGLGFSLNAVGGMLGINHDFDEQALVDALPQGAMDDVLFPANPVGDAPRIISSLRTIFPVRQDVWTLGLTAELGWSRNLCSVRLGLILPLGNRTSDPANDGFVSIYLLGRLAVECFDSLPTPIRLSLICDFVSQIGVGASGISIAAYGQLRDSRFGLITIEGGIAFSVRTGPAARFLIAAGGFHPDFKNIPDDLPAHIDRLGANYDVGVIKAWVHAYLAIASGSVQFGFDMGCRYKLGPLAFRADIGGDALIHLHPFSFETGARANAAVTYHGHELLGVHLSLTVWGPDRWRIKGHGSFSVLGVDIDIDVDESWGKDVEAPPARIALSVKVREDLLDAGNWTYSLPGAGDTLVTIYVPAGPDGATQPLAHPLAAVSYTQRRVPFGLDMQRVGSCAIEGATLFPVPAVATADGDPVGNAGTLYDQFAVPEFLNLTEDEKLTRPSFETLPAGVTVGAGGYTVPDSVEEVPIECELIFSKKGSGLRITGLAEFEGLGLHRITAAESAGLSLLQPLQPPRPGIDPVIVNPSTWVAVDTLRLDAAGVGADESLVHSAAAVSASATRGLTVVEAFEVAGGL